MFFTTSGTVRQVSLAHFSFKLSQLSTLIWNLPMYIENPKNDSTRQGNGNHSQSLHGLWNYCLITWNSAGLADPSDVNTCVSPPKRTTASCSRKLIKYEWFLRKKNEIFWTKIPFMVIREEDWRRFGDKGRRRLLKCRERGERSIQNGQIMRVGGAASTYSRTHDQENDATLSPPPPLFISWLEFGEIGSGISRLGQRSFKSCRSE